MRRHPHEVRAAWLMYLFAAVVAALVVSLHGCGDAFEDPCVVPNEQLIIEGTPSVDRRSTAYVASETMFCSSVVLGAHTLLSAGHCDGLVRGFTADGGFTITDELLHPNYAYPRADLRLLYTKEALPRPYARLATGPIECGALVAQGYGAGGGGVLSERVVQAVGRTGTTIVTTSGPCNGDSGGGLWTLEGTLVGIASWAQPGEEPCEGNAGYTAVAYYGNWLQENIK